MLRVYEDTDSTMRIAIFSEVENHKKILKKITLITELDFVELNDLESFSDLEDHYFNGDTLILTPAHFSEELVDVSDIGVNIFIWAN